MIVCTLKQSSQATLQKYTLKRKILMKKYNLIFIIIAFATSLFAPVCALISLISGYPFSFPSYTAFSILLVVMLAICSAVLTVCREDGVHFSGVILAAVCPFVFMINWLIYMVKSESKAVVIIMTVGLLLSCYITYIVVKNVWIKLGSVAATVFIMVPICFVCFIVYGLHIENSFVKKTVTSSDGNYCAQVVVSTRGGFGERTYLDVYDRNNDVNLGFVKFNAPPKRFYKGDFSLKEDVKMYWSVKDALIIDDEKFEF